MVVGGIDDVSSGRGGEPKVVKVGWTVPCRGAVES